MGRDDILDSLTELGFSTNEARAYKGLLVESPATGATRRDGEIVALHHADGTPPYDVRWSDTGEVTLVFPGPDAHIDHLSAHDDAPASRSAHGSFEAPPADARPGRPGDIGRRLTAARRP